MRKLKNYVLHLLAALSVAAAVLLLVSWVVGWKWEFDLSPPVPSFISGRPGTELFFAVSNATFGAGERRITHFTDQEKARIVRAYGSGDHKRNWLGFGYEYGESCFLETVAAKSIPDEPYPGIEFGTGACVYAPTTSLIPLLVLFPVWFWHRRWRKWFRHRNNLCGKCGYDLRESRVRCPECGDALIG